MLELLVGLVALFCVLVFLVGGILGIAAYIQGRGQRARLSALFAAVESLRRRIGRLEPAAGPREPPPPEPEPPATTPEPAPPAWTPPAPAAPAVIPRQAPAREAVAERIREDWQRFEDTVGRRWMTWAGAGVLFLAVGFFVKYAVDRGWLGPTARVVLGVAFGLVLVGCGHRWARKGLRVFGQGLMGGGLAILYVSLFASFTLYHLVPQAVAFGAMALVTAGGMTLAVRHEAVGICLLALVGGLLTPILLSTGEDARDVLFSYVLLLDLGVLGVALFRRWRALDVVAFAGTAILFAGWFLAFYEDTAMVPTLLWLGAFYAVFLVLPFLYHFRQGTPITVERFLMAVAAAGLTFLTAYAVLHAQHRHALGFVALGMSACYLALGVQARRRIPADERAPLGFLGMAVTFLTISVPLHLKLHGITVAWSAEAPLLVYLGYHYSYRPVRIGGFVVLVLVLLRVCAVEWPLHDASFVLLCNRAFWSAMCVPIGGALAALLHARWRESATDLDSLLQAAAGIGAGFIALVLVHAELSQWLLYGDHAYLSRCVGPAVWALGAVAFVGSGLFLRSSAARGAGVVSLVFAAVLALRAYAGTGPDEFLLFVNVRFIVSLLAVLAVFAHAHLLRRFEERCIEGEAALRVVLLSAGLVMLWGLLSTDAYAYCLENVADARRAQWTALMSVSLVWGVYAAALLAVGFRKRLLPLRLAALGLFAATAVKLVLVDIAGVRQIYRIVAFFVLGMLMIGAAYVYHRIERHLSSADEGETP